MEPASGRDSQVRIGFAPEEVSVLNWPLWQEGWRAWLMLAGGAALVALLAQQSQSPLLASVVAAVLVLTGWRLWLPVRFELRRHGVVQIVLGRRTRIPWTSIGSYRCLARGVLLLPDDDDRAPTRLQSLFIAWSGHRAEMLANLEYYLGTRPKEGRSTATAPAASARE